MSQIEAQPLESDIIHTEWPKESRKTRWLFAGMMACIVLIAVASAFEPLLPEFVAYLLIGIAFVAFFPLYIAANRTNKAYYATWRWFRVPVTITMDQGQIVKLLASSAGDDIEATAKSDIGHVLKAQLGVDIFRQLADKRLVATYQARRVKGMQETRYVHYVLENAS